VRARQRGRGGGGFACAWLCLGGLGLGQLWLLCCCLGLCGAGWGPLIITGELQKRLSALFTKVDWHFVRACAPEDLLPVKEVLIRACRYR